MDTQLQVPARLPSEDVIISAPMSYTGSAQRIWRLRRRARSDEALAALTALTVLLIVIVWALVTAWYATWGLLLVPYRVVRRGARKRRVEAMRHRELLGAIQGSAATRQPVPPSPDERVSDADRERAIEELRQHMLAGRVTAAEFETGVGSLHRAVTRGDVATVMTGLPTIG
jgi:hypothetical protein